MNDTTTTSRCALAACSAFLLIYEDGWTRGIQLAIEDETGSGFRIAGPKFNGSGKLLLKYKISERDAKVIRSYLNQAFPPNGSDEARRTEHQ